MGRLTAGRGADPYRTTTTSVPQTRQGFVPSTGYSFGNPAQNLLDQMEFNKAYLRESASYPSSLLDKRYYPPGVYRPASERPKRGYMPKGVERFPGRKPVPRGPWTPGYQPPRSSPAGRALPRVDPGPLPLPSRLGRMALQQVLQLVLNNWQLPWAQLKEETPGTYDLAGAGFSQGCSGVPSMSFPHHNIAVAGTAQFLLCAPVESANFGHTNAGQYGQDDIPAGVANVAFPWGNTDTQFDGQNSEWWFRGSPTTQPVEVQGAQKRVVAPLPLSDPEPAQETEQISGRRSARRSVSNEPFNDWGWNFQSQRKDPPSGGRSFPTGPSVSVSPVQPYRPGPPSKGTRERKWKLGKGGKAGDLFGALTEAADAFDCAYAAAGGKGSGGGLMNKVEFVANNFDVGNAGMVQSFVSCMIQSQLKDAIIGASSGLADKKRFEAYEALGIPVDKRPGRGISLKRGPSPF